MEHSARSAREAAARRAEPIYYQTAEDHGITPTAPEAVFSCPEEDQ